MISILKTQPVLSRGVTTLGYELTRKTASSDPAHGATVLRTEEELKAFHAQAARVLGEKASGDLAFPLKEWKSGFEFLPGLVFVCALAGGVAVAGMELVPALGMATALSSLTLLGVAMFGLALLPVTWNASKRVGPVTEYLNRVAQLLQAAGQGALVDALLEPPLVADWPSRVGDIDLHVHDAPHDSAATEWWYYNGHFEGRNAADPSAPPKKFSFFASFFRVVKHVDERTGAKAWGHALTWALVDASSGAYWADVTLERDAPKTILASMDKGDAWGPSDPFIRRALLDVLKKGNVPLPDRLMKQDPLVALNTLDLNYDGSTLDKDQDGNYVLNLHNANGTCTASLVVSPSKAAVRHGDHGVVKGHDGAAQDMFYYFIPRCGLTGTVRVPERVKNGGGAVQVTEYVVAPGGGQAWYDHEFGGMIQASSPKPTTNNTREKMDYAWNWVAVQLSNNVEVSAAVLLDPRAKKVIETKAVVVAPSGERSQFDETSGASLEELPGERWTSVRTFRSYPVGFKLTVKELDMELFIRAAFPDQECMTILSKPAFWEGRCEVTGTVRGLPVSGLAFLERNGFDPDQNLNTFFKNVGVAVRDSVMKCYPLRPTQEEAITLCADQDTAHYVDDVPLDVLGDTLFAPVRLIADRGGKSWRSYAALACVDAVGGDSRQFVQWVAMPEFLHVGSLIVDDIQDKSETRRGGPCAHLVYGEPLAINAGTAAYFMCEQLLSAPDLTDENRIKCYKLFFAALRGGHAGQALDIYGNDYMMQDVVATGDATLLEKRILAIHRLKTAVPAGTLARLGATVGGGSNPQIEAIGRFMEAVGVAFQIMDDVLNLRGIYADKADKLKQGTKLKNLGEDITCGKITYPLAKYMGKVKDLDKRQRMWELIQSKPSDPDVVQGVIDELEAVGAVQDCKDESDRIVAEAWDRVDAIIPDSFSKMMLRSFGWFVTEQCA